MRQRRLLSSALIVLTLAMGVAIGTVISEQVSATQDGPTPLTIPEPVQLSNSFREIAERVGPAVVNIEVEVRMEAAELLSPFGGLPEGFEDFFGFGLPTPAPDGLPQVRPSEGSGFIVDPDGYILTNNHVVEGATSINVRLADDTEYDAEVVGSDPETDIAVIRITDPVSNLPAIEIGNSDGLAVGDWVLAVGSPFGFDQTLTAGIVSATGRQASESQFQRFIQTDAAINPGNSGGPLVNLQGQVVGINTAIISGTRQFSGIGFAMPSNVAVDVYNQIIANGQVTRGWIGIEYTEDRLQLESVGHDQGVLVQAVIPGGPAEAAGLEFGDVITAVDGNPVTKGDDLLSTVVAKSVGDPVALTVDRVGETLNMTLTIAARPSNPRRPALTDNLPRRGAPGGSEFESETLGVTVRNLTPQIREMPGGRDVEGVLIVAVDPNGPGAEAGLTRNLIISEVRIGRSERVLVTDVDDFRGAEDALQGSNVTTIALRVIDPAAQFAGGFIPVPIR